MLDLVEDLARRKAAKKKRMHAEAQSVLWEKLQNLKRKLYENQKQGE